MIAKAATPSGAAAAILGLEPNIDFRLDANGGSPAAKSRSAGAAFNGVASVDAGRSPFMPYSPQPPPPPPRSPQSPSSRTYICRAPGCGKHFQRSYNLKVHQRLHTGDKPYVCEQDQCTRRFAWKASLDSHMLSHRRHKFDCVYPSSTPQPPLLPPSKTFTAVNSRGAPGADAAHAGGPAGGGGVDANESVVEQLLNSAPPFLMSAAAVNRAHEPTTSWTTVQSEEDESSRTLSASVSALHAPTSMPTLNLSVTGLDALDSCMGESATLSETNATVADVEHADSLFCTPMPELDDELWHALEVLRADAGSYNPILL